jgi:hypothetical protein
LSRLAGAGWWEMSSHRLVSVGGCRLEQCLAAATTAQTEVNHATEYANFSTLFGSMASEIRENREQTARLHVLMDELTSCGVLSLSATLHDSSSEDERQEVRVEFLIELN